jgi:hypothetical protein
MKITAKQASNLPQAPIPARRNNVPVLEIEVVNYGCGTLLPQQKVTTADGIVLVRHIPFQDSQAG